MPGGERWRQKERKTRKHSREISKASEASEASEANEAAQPARPRLGQMRRFQSGPSLTKSSRANKASRAPPPPPAIHRPPAIAVGHLGKIDPQNQRDPQFSVVVVTHRCNINPSLVDNLLNWNSHGGFIVQCWSKCGPRLFHASPWIFMLPPEIHRRGIFSALVSSINTHSATASTIVVFTAHRSQANLTIS